jgi:hypothetical protein
MKRCKHYPDDNDDSGPICGAGSDVSGHECTEEDEKNCQWAKELIK